MPPKMFNLEEEGRRYREHRAATPRPASASAIATPPESSTRRSTNSKPTLDEPAAQAPAAERSLELLVAQEEKTPSLMPALLLQSRPPRSTPRVHALANPMQAERPEAERPALAESGSTWLVAGIWAAAFMLIALLLFMACSA